MGMSRVYQSRLIRYIKQFILICQVENIALMKQMRYVVTFQIAEK